MQYLGGQDGPPRADHIKQGLEISESVTHVHIIESIFSRDKSQESYSALGVCLSRRSDGAV